MNVIKQLAIMAILFIFVTLFCATPALADETIQIALVAETQNGEIVPVPHALCKVTIDDDIKEYWTDTEGILTIPAVSATISVAPTILPQGFGFSRQVIPILELESSAKESIPQKGESPPVIKLQVTSNIPSISFSVRDERGLGIKDIGISLSSQEGAFQEIIYTDVEGEASLPVGSGVYEIRIETYPRVEYTPYDPFLLYVVEDRTSNIVLSDLMPYDRSPDITEKDEPPIESTPLLNEDNPYQDNERSRQQIGAFQIMHMLLTLVTLLGVIYLVLVNMSIRKEF